MAYGLWLASASEEIADQVRNDALGEASHRLLAISHGYFITLNINNIRKKTQKIWLSFYASFSF